MNKNIVILILFCSPQIHAMTCQIESQRGDIIAIINDNRPLMLDQKGRYFDDNKIVTVVCTNSPSKNPGFGRYEITPGTCATFNNPIVVHIPGMDGGYDQVQDNWSAKGCEG